MKVIMSWSVRKVKTFEGREGQGFNAELLRDGKPVAAVTDDASGGEYRFSWYDWHVPKAEFHVHDFRGTVCSHVGTPEERLLCEHADAQTYVNELNGNQYHMDADMFVGQLVDTYANNRTFRRLSRTRTLFRLKSDPDGGWSSIRIPYSTETATKLLKQYGSELVQVYDPAVGL